MYGFTYSDEGEISASQMCLLFDLLSQDNSDSFKKIKLLAPPPGLYDIEVDADLLKDQYVVKGFREVKAGFDPVRTHSIDRNT